MGAHPSLSEWDMIRDPIGDRLGMIKNIISNHLPEIVK